MVAAALLIILILALVLLARTVYERTRKTGTKTTTYQINATSNKVVNGSYPTISSELTITVLSQAKNPVVTSFYGQQSFGDPHCIWRRGNKSCRVED